MLTITQKFFRNINVRNAKKKHNKLDMAKEPSLIQICTSLNVKLAELKVTLPAVLETTHQ